MTNYKLMPVEATPEMEQAAERYWNERRFKGLSDDPRTWQGLYKAMCDVAPAEQPPALARYQPCGCVVCTCEHETQCQGCGAHHCGTHPVGQFSEPAYQQPAPDVAGLIICDECHAKCSEPYTGLFSSHCPDEEPCLMCECSSLRRQLASRSGVPVESDVKALVEALESLLRHAKKMGRTSALYEKARAALAAHRKQGGQP